MGRFEYFEKVVWIFMFSALFYYVTSPLYKPGYTKLKFKHMKPTLVVKLGLLI